MTDGNSRTASAAPAGVGGSALQHLQESSVACWYSESEAVPERAKEDVLAFHRVIETFFRGGAVVPFRFPTTLPDTRALSTWLGVNAPAVHRELQRLAPMV